MAFSHAKKYISTAEAEEVTGEVFVTIWKRRSDFSSLNSLKKFILVSVRNAAVDLLRKSKLSKVISLEDAEAFYSEEDIFSQVKFDVLQAVDAAISQLPSQQREVILLSYKYGYKIDKIAATMGISSQTVKNYKRLALDKLRHSLSGVEFIILLSIIEPHFRA